MGALGRVLAPVAMRALRSAAIGTAKMTKAIHCKFASATQPLSRNVQHVTIRSSGRQPIHSAAFLRQSKRGARWSSSTPYGRLHATFLRFITSAATELRAGSTVDRSALNKSNVGRAFAQFPGRAPFAHTLRPNLTGGSLPRTAGGYAVPGSGRFGSQRYFSHCPSSQAQVVQNVSQAMRAFWLSGHRARFDGYGPNGEKRYRSVGELQDSIGRKMASMASMPHLIPGSFIDFHISPTLTALSPIVLATAPGFHVKPEPNAATLNCKGFLDELSTDFSRHSKDLAAVMADLETLAVLGDLPITLEQESSGMSLRVRFPGLDVDTVERLCDDMGIQRGIIRQDPEFKPYSVNAMSWHFPCPLDMQDVDEVFPSPGGSLRSQISDQSSFEEEQAMFDEYLESNPWLSTFSPGTKSEDEGSKSMGLRSRQHSNEDFEGLEGIYRFLEECDRLKPRSRPQI